MIIIVMFNSFFKDSVVSPSHNEIGNPQYLGRNKTSQEPETKAVNFCEFQNTQPRTSECASVQGGDI